MTAPRKHELTSGEETTRSNNRRDLTGSEPRAEAISPGTPPSPDRAAQRAPVRAVGASLDQIGSVANHSPLLFLDNIAPLPGLRIRETSVVYLTVMLRLVGYDQLRRLLFPHQNPAAVRKLARTLEEEGWLQRWNAPTPGVGRLGHLHPTAKALNAVLDKIPAVVAHEPWSKVVHLMLPRTGRRAMELSSPPKWFPHQREINHLATGILLTRRPFWISTWDSPFPAPRRGDSPLPQPDYVLIEPGEEGPRLTFGEHDRGHEPLERFSDRKLRAYTRLAALSDELLGVSDFRVNVTVTDVRTQNPIARLRQLMEVTRNFGALDLFRFTLGGWLYTSPCESIWFDTPPTGNSVRRQDHDRLTH